MTEILDSTLAAAFPGFKSVWGFFEKGGVFMIPLVITCMAGIVAVIYKFLSLAPSRVIPDGLVWKLSQGITEPVVREFNEGNSSLARLGAVALKNHGRPREQVNSAIEAAAREEVVHLHSGVGVLDIVITIAPLLGLVGTASGLVVIFEGLGDASDHTMITRGIAEALSTTIFGIAVAVPAVIAHGYFTRRIEKQTARLEGILSEVSLSLTPVAAAQPPKLP